MHLPLIMSARPQLAVGQLDRSALMDLLRKLDVDGGGVAKFEFVVGMLLQARCLACCGHMHVHKSTPSPIRVRIDAQTPLPYVVAPTLLYHTLALSIRAAATTSLWPGRRAWWSRATWTRTSPSSSAPTRAAMAT